uniref:Cbb3-type cytochrome c oxidase subunit n=1 Tax=Candidatus Kentrum sp. FM TaxID=2126340 RepID=A0A450SZ11_9GAMM|nr:MAG: cytochrome c oxidase cbb3-type subunit 3 [Candidatus Kentron sp. FM]VFJ62250.1 MAG: cytochrome c oxidase cbb3-type subunit 3 [Candidatus Kentron sp. FM]VFK12454.1 MAG: cytochrome c oxidase cbb3-type subunit 3 [Candidatus Kentron sp. FM]
MADRNPFPGENNTGHIWDDNIRELTNPPPGWWMIAFIASFLFVVGYSFLYPTWPGITGFTKGMLGWTSIKEYKEGMAEVDKVRDQFENRLSGLSAKQIIADKELSDYTLASAKVLFGDNCAACHGKNGQGNPGFPVLADDNWLYGGTIEKIQQTITMGRKGIMPAHAKSLSEPEIDTLANYAAGLSQGKGDPKGKNLFTQKGCFACHGMDAKGMQAMGSANLTDAIWRFVPEEGKTAVDSARRTITHGVNDGSDPNTRNAQMPSFKDRLGEDAIKKLAVFVHQKWGSGQ